VASGQDPAEQLDEIELLCQSSRVPLDLVSRSRFDSIVRTDSAQGVVALTRPIDPVDLDDLVYDVPNGHQPFLLVGAGITDPRNLGALLRSAECAGVNGVVLPRHRSARLSPTVAKTAAGAIEHLRFATVPGIPAGLERLGKLGVMTVGMAGEAKRSLFDVDLGNTPVALVLGEEERGLAPLVRRRCDELVAIPQFGEVESLNVSVAGAVAMYEVARQRIAAGA
jgi:23S rRNA (guanosine2251-2'-O)-methyltransferase